MDLLIAILIALGFNVSEGASAEEIKEKDLDAYNRAVEIMETGSYEKTAGGIVIDTSTGD